jgi:hypothetical protein
MTRSGAPHGDATTAAAAQSNHDDGSTITCEACVSTERHGWHGIDGAAHCHDCHLTWTSKRAAHCPVCCCHFTSYSAADLHDGPNGCLPPAEVEGLKLAADGFSWRRADEHTWAVSAPGSAVLAEEAS